MTLYCSAQVDSPTQCAVVMLLLSGPTKTDAVGNSASLGPSFAPDAIEHPVHLQTSTKQLSTIMSAVVTLRGQAPQQVRSLVSRQRNALFVSRPVATVAKGFISSTVVHSRWFHLDAAGAWLFWCCSKIANYLFFLAHFYSTANYYDRVNNSQPTTSANMRSGERGMLSGSTRERRTRARSRNLSRTA